MSICEPTISIQIISFVTARPPEWNNVSPDPSPMMAIVCGLGWISAGRKPSTLCVHPYGIALCPSPLDITNDRLEKSLATALDQRQPGIVFGNDDV
jgi:hypothetical protein